MRNVALIIILACISAAAGCCASADDEMDEAFATQLYALDADFLPLNAEMNSAPASYETTSDYQWFASVCSRMSNLSQHWYDTLEKMPVSSRLTEVKELYLLALKEYEAGGIGGQKVAELAIAGNSDANALWDESRSHFETGVKYLEEAQRIVEEESEK